MNLLTALHALLYAHTYFITWRAIVEILFFSSLFYQISLWLKKDRHHNLLPYWYGYCALGFTAYCLQLSAISNVLFLFAPATLTLFLILHQEQLQKNFVALRTITPARPVSSDWLEQVMRSCIVAVNNNRSLVCVIERKDSLQEFLETPFMFNAELHSATFDMLITGDSYNENALIWLNDHGTLRGINATWRTSTDEWKSDTKTELPTWQHDALFFTSKTDAITLGIDREHRTFTIITSGKRFENIAAHNALKFIKKLINHNEKGDTQYDVSQSNTRNKQPHA